METKSQKFQNFTYKIPIDCLSRYTGLVLAILWLGGFLFICGCDDTSKKVEQIVIASKPVKEVEAKNADSECAPLVGQVVLMNGRVTYTRIVSVGSSIELDDRQNCTFEPKHKKEIANLKKGDFVRVKGIVESVTALGVHLSHCILVNETEMK